MSSSQQQPVEPFALRHKKDILYVPHDPKLDPPPRTCFKCHQPGHSLHKCSMRPDYELCFNCGRRDVRMSNCPRCRVAWQKHHAHKDAPASGEANNKDDCASTSSAESVENVEVPPPLVEDKCSDKDPVQEIKELLESIKHLSVETQDLVVKQVILERREKLERRSKTEPSSAKERSKPKAATQAYGTSKTAKSSSTQSRMKQEKEQPQRGFPRQDNHNDAKWQVRELAAIAAHATKEFVEKRQALRDQKGGDDDIDDIDDW